MGAAKEQYARAAAGARNACRRANNNGLGPITDLRPVDRIEVARRQLLDD